MLIEFQVANFRSIRDRQTLSMVADTGKEHLETHTFDSGIKRFDRLLASAAIYGPNAAGKTNLLKALQFMQSVVVNSAAQVATSLSGYAPSMPRMRHGRTTSPFPPPDLKEGSDRYCPCNSVALPSM